MARKNPTIKRYMEIPLNEKQKAVIENGTGSMLIIAGAGTGKTRVLVEKVIHLLSQGVHPSSIITLTFTNKAGDEMRDRIRSQLGNDHIPFIGTFHSFCVSLLREFGDTVGLKTDFIILDANATKKILRRCLKNAGVDDVKPGALQKVISDVKTQQALTGEEHFTMIQNSEVQKVARTILPEYQKVLAQEGATDFDDLLIYAVKLLSEYQDTRNKVRSRYKYIFVDEFQDTDDLQNKLISLLKHKDTSVIVVGDTDQTIYSWRGANIYNLLDFEKRYTGAKTFFLTQNYRSTKNILSAANAVIEKNSLRQKKELEATKADGDPITLMCSYDEETEGESIAGKILQLHREGIPYNDMAILFRANFQSRALEMQLLRHDIPYTVLGTRFFDRSEIQGLVAYLTLTQKPNAFSAYERASGIPRRGIGKTTLEKIAAGQRNAIAATMQRKVIELDADIQYITEYAQTHTVAETLNELVKHLRYKDYLEKSFDNPDERMLHIAELIQFAERFSHLQGGESVLQFLSEISLGSDQDGLRVHTKRNAVRLMTVHAAKGLEFACVFIAGMEEGLFPLVRAELGEANEDAEEERRLCYVAMTRAKNLLHCSFARRRGIFGVYKQMKPSSFLHDIPKDLLADAEHLMSRYTETEDPTDSAVMDSEEREIQW